MLKTAEVVEDHSGADEVGMDTKVVLYYEDEDETEEVKIVTSIQGEIPWRVVSASNHRLAKPFWDIRPVTVSMSG